MTLIILGIIVVCIVFTISLCRASKMWQRSEENEDLS